jgi:pantetheine-phosphate adenylyltransferase
VRVLLGGTFTVLHKAHKEMIKKGLELGNLTIGLTSNSFRFNKGYEVPSYESRKRSLEAFLAGMNGRAEIRPLDDQLGATMDPSYDAIIASNETFDFISNINFMRKSKGITPLLVVNVGTILADDLMPIKSERILHGRIDENGKRIKEIELVLVTKNEEKIEGARLFFKRVFDKFQMNAINAKGNFVAQPINQEIFEGALRRAEGVEGEYDYAIGIEAGVLSNAGSSYDIHVAAVKDSLGKVNFGISSGLPLSDSMMNSIKMGRNLEEVTDMLVGVEKSGKLKGAIYYLSKGLKERRQLVEESLISAFTQRIAEAIPRKSI